MTATTTPKQFPDRWRLTRAGIVNVWHYLENEFDLSGGRMILRGTNGSGKSRALELLLPFLLDADRRKMDATGSGRVSLDDLMATGADEQTNRTGYLWLELAGRDEVLTIGALVRYSRSSKRTQVWYFLTPLRVGDELSLLSEAREPLSRDALGELIGAENITEAAETHRERVRSAVFGLDGDAGRDRFDGLRQLLHTVRSPDIGNRIDEGNLPRIVSDSLPPLDDQTLARAGERLDDLTATRQAQQRLEESLDHVAAFLDVYRRYAAATILDTSADTLATVEALATATRAADDRAAEFAARQAELADRRAREESLRGEVDELQLAIDAIRARDIFKQADDLVQRERVVGTLAAGADGALAEAGRERDNLARAVGQTDDRAADVREAADAAAAALAGARRALLAADLADTGLPDEIRVALRSTEAGRSIIRVDRNSEPRPVSRPNATELEVWPADPAAAVPTVQAAGAAATKRGELAELRLVAARRLEDAERAVLALESDAANAEVRAGDDDTEAARHADDRDARAVELAGAWHAWVGEPATTQLLGDLDWTTEVAVAAVLIDPDVLVGPDARVVLADLDAAAARQARPARTAVVTRRAALDQAARTDDELRARLLAEAVALRRDQDPAPADAPWLAADRPGVPFWQAVDFIDSLTDDERAGIEGALLAAGVLTAAIERDGTVRAGDGSVLLTPGTTARAPLTAALCPDPAGALPESVVRAVLAGIGLNDGSPTAVSIDGSWRNGPLRGRHVVPAARHIGAAARAAARRERLAEIDAALRDLDLAAETRRARLAELDELDRHIDAHLTTAPRSAELHAARGLAAASARRAETSRAAARAAVDRARESRASWAAELDIHRRTCEHYGLPAAADQLTTVRHASSEAAGQCAGLSTRLAELVLRIARHADTIVATLDVARTCDDAEGRAGERWREWRDLAAEVGALREAIGLDVEQAHAELAASENALRTAKRSSERAHAEVTALGPAVGTARTEAEHARADVDRRREAMIAAARRFNLRAAMPGLVHAATDQQVATIDRPDDSAEVRLAAESVTAVVHRPPRPADANAVLRAFQTFDREVSGQLDTAHRVDDGVTLVTVVGVGDDHTLAGAAAALGTAVEKGRAALTEREREVFTTFVLGGVAEELRRRINQAAALVAAMNGSLGSIRTSNGIGVKLGWHLVDDSPELRRIATLVATADAVRSAADTAELTELLRRRVEDQHAGDPTSGYAAHLAAALDYRAWHEVDVTILGPEPGQQRRISKRAKLSQGETRFVSYVTLFAAADGYLSGLASSGRQLRLILLDDAFAKVDDPTIAELMGLLVHLDLDFVMTGHALWGCYASVPSLDVYEVRRQEGTSAVTTHIHWDGRTRHLRSTA